MLEVVSNVNSFLNNIFWGWPALILLAFVGIFMTCWTKFFQITHIGHWMKETIGAIFHKDVVGHTQDKSISQFQSLCTALAATVGTGNIVGVAGAIMVGGPGAVFWMWLIAFFGMMTNYSENVLGIYFRRKNERGEWRGGAMYYLRDGLGAKKNCRQLGSVLAVLFSVFCVLASFGIGNMSQINSIAGNMYAAFMIPKPVTGVILMVLAGLVVIGGIKRIASVTEKLVPFMAIVYIVGALVVCIVNIDQAGAVFGAIFKGAFGMKAVGGGIVGSGVKMAVTWGMKRGVFSNEAGLGSSVMVHSSSNVKEPVRQGMWGIFEVFADTIVVCTLTAFSVLSSGLVDLETGAELCGRLRAGRRRVRDSVRSGRPDVHCDRDPAVRVLNRAWLEPLRDDGVRVPVRGGRFDGLPRDFHRVYRDRRNDEARPRVGYLRYVQRPDGDPEPDRRPGALPGCVPYHGELCEAQDQA